MAMASSPRIQKLLVGLGILIASLFGLKSLAATLEAPTVRPEQRSRYTIFQHAIQHADWFNWADAGLEFQQAERFFTNQHDPRNALYSRIGVLRGTMEDHSLTEVQKQLAEIAPSFEPHNPSIKETNTMRSECVGCLAQVLVV